MKKLLLLCITAVMMAGCGVPESNDRKLCERVYHTIVLDSCEYLSCKKRYDLTHKGNCRFCKERRQKELEELIIKLRDK